MAKNAADLLFVNLSFENEHREVILAALDGVYSPPQSAHMGPYHVQMSYGPEIIEMPFSLRLDDFQLERYPGSISPSSYASELTVEDPESSFPYRISMNNVLDHDGFRFFQASYDLDEKGTVLSVNKDFWGTQVTYLGYTLMGLGMILTLFGKNSRFRFVARQLKELKAGASILIVMAMATPGFAQPEDIAELPVVDEAHAKKFGKLLVQDMDGRIKPLNTLSSEFLRKLTRSTTYTLDASKGLKLNSDQLFLAVHQNPILWQNIPLIIIDQEKGAGIFTQLGVEPTEMFSFRDLLNFEGDYKMRLLAEMAQRKKPAERSEFDNEILKVDERFNILYQALSGNYLKIFPQKEHPDNKWFNDNFINADFAAEDSLFVRNRGG